MCVCVRRFVPSPPKNMRNGREKKRIQLQGVCICVFIVSADDEFVALA